MSEIIEFKPANSKQNEALDALLSNKFDIIGLFGPTGTGKSLLALITGINEVLQGRFERIVVSKPIVEVDSGESLRLVDFNKYIDYIYEYIRDLLVPFKTNINDLINYLIKNNLIEIVQPFYIRGRSFDNSFIFLDDIQNLPIDSLIEIITRLGNNSKLVVAGDPIFQTRNTENSAVLGREILREEENSKVIDFGLKDIVRPGARRGIRLLFELRLRKRKLSKEELLIYSQARLQAPDADIVTVISLVDLKKKYNIIQLHVPDALIIVKRSHLGRLIGIRGERINSIENETGYTIRAIELTLDFKEYFRAIHPVAWIHSKILDTDLEGYYIAVYVKREDLGPLLGQKGYYIRFMSDFFEKAFGAKVIAKEYTKKHLKTKFNKRNTKK